MNGAVGLPLPANSSPSVINMYRIQKVTERLGWLAQPGNRGDPKEFYNHCLSLSRGIDYALANGEIPTNAHELPLLVKKICQLKNDELSQAAMMVLMISVKGACEIGWFQTKESQELLTILDEIGKVFSSMGSINATPRQCSSEISTIMEKFYPHVKLGSILASIEIQPGYGASLVGFHITKSEFVKEKLFLLVAQIDNIEISACLISPPQANFLLNGKGVANRTYVEMDPGPQMPTDVTAMLKFGTNLLQTVGQFNGRYIVLVAYMSFTPLHEDPVLQDYLQPAVTSTDSDIVEGASQISLNCPISFTRIKTPVKGRSCKHFQCFDFNNFLSINSKRPSWRCPHCNQYVCYADIRLDRNMVEILKNVGESITEVIVLADGSWKAVLEKDHDVDKMQKKAPNHEKEQTEPQEHTCSPATVDLTEDDDHVEAMDTSEIVDRKPLQASLQSHFVAPNSTSFGMNTPGVNRNVAGQMDDFLSGVYIARSRSDTPMVGTLELPVLPDTISPTFNQESAGRDNNSAVNSAMRNQISAPNNLPMQMNQMNSVNEYGRSSSVPRHINRIPVAVQALPVQSQASGDTLKAILSDTERQQRFSRTPINLPQVSGVNSPAFRHHNATQNRVPLQNPPTSTQLQNPYRPSSISDFSNPHLQQSLNLLPSRQHSNFRPSTTPWSHIQQGVPQSGNLKAAGMAAPPAARQGISNARNVPPAATTAHSQQSRGLAANQPPRWTPPLVPVQNQSGAAGTPFATDSFQGRGNTAHSVSRPDELFSTPPEQNWAPTGRMRGSLDLSQPFDESIAQRIITPTQTQGSRPPPPQPLRRATGSTQQDVLIANRNANTHNRPST
ncbi:E4 SUMO-protein ligase PIAL2 isoform X2 [Vigna radiata var. radiata]|uniref:E4 SUMO-protein ligase PIAL2 isoform X2 n=1 Tax=Vigna radiata var. radiata TaxID=3916 RepID=A0A3Q0FKF8_VIGRR|nr:E4 SUMO-protein ligase PIAL2 isoform X2 [Vigna radiata var. radiata]